MLYAEADSWEGCPRLCDTKPVLTTCITEVKAPILAEVALRSGYSVVTWFCSNTLVTASIFGPCLPWNQHGVPEQACSPQVSFCQSKFPLNSVKKKKSRQTNPQGFITDMCNALSRGVYDVSENKIPHKTHINSLYIWNMRRPIV